MDFKLKLQQGISKTLTGIFSAYFIFSSKGEYSPFPKVVKDFSPCLRFIACSDIHINQEAQGLRNADKFRKLIKKGYELCEGASLDALIIAGDFTDSGKKEEYALLKAVTDKELKEGTKLLICMGNHEFNSYEKADKQKACREFEKHFGKGDTHNIIGGYHFIGLSFDENGKESFKTKSRRIKNELFQAVEKSGGKPVFMFQHPHPFMTVYGSINWGNRQIKKLLKNFAQVINFSGHSHYAPNDPRSVYQGYFTAVGCGSVRGSMGNLNYIDGDKYGDGESGSFLFVEADEKGNVRLRAYDIISDCFFNGVDYFFAAGNTEGRKAYTWYNCLLHDTPPAFPKGAKISVKVSEGGKIKLSFPEARGFYKAENYKICLKKGRKSVYSRTVLSNYIREKDSEKTVDLGKLSKGKYTAEVNAFSPYAKRGERLFCEFEV